MSGQERRVVNEADRGPGVFSTAVAGGGLVFVSGLSAGPGSPAARPGDIQTETRATLDRLRAVLERAGSSLSHTVSLQVYLRRAADFAAMNGVYRDYFADAPPVRTTVATALSDGALINIAAVALPAGAARTVLHPPGWIKSPRPYSYIVRAGHLVFLSGLVSRRGTDDTVVPGPVALQTRTILDNAGVLLRTAGLSYQDVVAARVFLTDDSYFEAMNEVYASYFPSAPPARATGVADLMGNDSAVEITLIASTEPKRALGAAVSPSLPLSSAIRSGNFVFLSGVLGNTDANARDVSAQTREVFTRVRRTLDNAGLSFPHVVDNLVYLPDVDHLKRVDEISAEFFPADPPARTAAGARLVARTGLVEMMMTAVA